MNKKSDSNQILGEESRYIVVTIADNRKLILGATDGFTLLEIMSRGMSVEEDWRNDYKLKLLEDKRKNDLSIRFITEQEIKEIKLEAIVDPPEEES